MINTDNLSVRNFRELIRRFERELFMHNNEACCGNITLAQCHTLLEIENKGKESLTELAKTLGLDKSTVSRTTDCLVNTGLIDRSVPAENRRMANLQLTDAGKKVCQTINHANDKYFEDTLSVLNEKETVELIRLLDKVIDRMIHLRSKNACCCK